MGGSESIPLTQASKAELGSETPARMHWVQSGGMVSNKIPQLTAKQVVRVPSDKDSKQFSVTHSMRGCTSSKVQASVTVGAASGSTGAASGIMGAASGTASGCPLSGAIAGSLNPVILSPQPRRRMGRTKREILGNKSMPGE